MVNLGWLSKPRKTEYTTFQNTCVGLLEHLRSLSNSHMDPRFHRSAVSDFVTRTGSPRNGDLKTLNSSQTDFTTFQNIYQTLQKRLRSSPNSKVHPSSDHLKPPKRTGHTHSRTHDGCWAKAALSHSARQQMSSHCAISHWQYPN